MQQAMHFPIVNYKTDHFNERIKERVGVNKSGTNKFISKVLTNGYRAEDFKKNSKVYNYLKKLCSNHIDRFSVFYRNYIVIFAYGNIALTIMHAPDVIIRGVKKSLKENKYNGNCSSKKN